MQNTGVSGSGTAPPNPAGWPDEVLAIVRGAITCEFATLTSDGRPVTWPVTPYLGEDGRTIDISTGLAYPMKAERARRMPVCSILFSDPVGSGLPDPPAVLVHGFASVRDRDLQANTDRYVRLSMGKVPDAWRGVPPFVIRMQRWYWARIWAQVTPIRIAWWPGGNTSGPSRTWDAPAGTRAPDSDFSLPVGRARQPAGFLGAGLVLSRRARLEAARRGQRVPRVRLPRPAA